MYRRDYFKKQVDQLGEMLAKLLADILRVKSGNPGDQTEVMSTSRFRELTGIDLNDIPESDDPDAIKQLLEKHQLSPEHLHVTADIFVEMADIQVSTNPDAALRLYKKSLVLYQYLSKNQSTYSLEMHWKMERIRALLP